MRPSENLESNLLKSLSHVGLCDPMDCSPPTSSVHRDSPGKNNGVGCHALLQGIFPMHPLLALFFPHGALVPSSQVCILSVCSLTAAAAEQGLAPRRYSASAEPVIAMENTVSTGGKNTHFAVLVFFFFFLAMPYGSLQDPGSPTSYGILPLGHQATPGLSSKEGGPCSPVVCHTGEGRGGAEHPGDWKELN